MQINVVEDQVLETGQESQETRMHVNLHLSSATCMSHNAVSLF